MYTHSQKKKKKNPCRLHARPLLLKLGQPQNEQSQPLCSSRQRREARLQLKLKLMAFLIGAHVCQSDRVVATWTTSAHLPRQRSLLPLVGRQLQSGWIKPCITTGSDGDVWFVILSNQAGTDSWADGVHSPLHVHPESDVACCIITPVSSCCTWRNTSTCSDKHRPAVSDQHDTGRVQLLLDNYLHLNQNMYAWLSLHVWQG